MPQSTSWTLLYFRLHWFCPFSSCRNNIPVKLCIFYCVKRCQNSCFDCYVFAMPDIYPDWVTTVQPVSVIWLSSSGLCLLIIKTLVLAKLHSFIQTIIYSKLAAFLPITFLKWKIYLKILYICGNLCLSVTNCQVCVLLNFFCEFTHGKSSTILSVSYGPRRCCLAPDILRYFFPGCNII